MDERCHYQLKVQNGVDEIAFNAASPLQVQVVWAEAGATLLAARADQAALIGLLRYLHQQGYLLLSVLRLAREDSESC